MELYFGSAKRRFLIACLLLSAALFALAAQARAADSVYWANYGAGTISLAGLAGEGGGNLDVAPASAINANGLAIDAAAGKAYWVTTEGQLRYANLSGGGGGELSTAGASPGFGLGLAIDPAGGRAYWVAREAGVITYARLDGSGGGGILDTSGATVESPTGVAIEPASGRIYWSNEGAVNRVAYASLAGGGGGNVDTSGTTGTVASGLAIDATAGLVFWADYAANKISYASLSGLGGADLNTAGATVDGPFGVAVDPIAGRVYWANEQGDSISYAALDGSGGADLNTLGATIGTPAFPVLLKAPSAVAAPLASGRPKPGSTLTCAAASWAPDLLGSFLSRAPRSTAVQWLKDGQPLAGATATTLTASAVGNYSCQSSATNQAGVTALSSNPVAIFRLGRKAKRNLKQGTATLTVKVPGAGTVTLAGKRVVKQKRTRKAGSAGTVKLLVKAKGKAKRTLGEKGKVRVEATVTFRPASGSAVSQSRQLTLKKKLG